MKNFAHGEQLVECELRASVVRFSFPLIPTNPDYSRYEENR